MRQPEGRARGNLNVFMQYVLSCCDRDASVHSSVEIPPGQMLVAARFMHQKQAEIIGGEHQQTVCVAQHASIF